MGRFGIQSRVRDHIRCLQLGRHGNLRLRELYLKDGLQSFEVYVLAVLPAHAVRREESRIIQKHRLWETGINQTYRACGPVVDEHTKELARQKQQRPFRLEKDGIIYEGVNLTAFAKERGLHQGALAQVHLGKMNQYKGWTLPGKSITRFLVKNPFGEVVEVPHHKATSFAKKHGLNPNVFNKLRRDKKRLHRGWSHVDADFSDYERAKSVTTKWASPNQRLVNAKPYRVMKDGVVYEGTNMSDFCRQHGVPVCTVSVLKGGFAKKYYGFTLAPESPLRQTG